MDRRKHAGIALAVILFLAVLAAGVFFYMRTATALEREEDRLLGRKARLWQGTEMEFAEVMKGSFENAGDRSGEAVKKTPGESGAERDETAEADIERGRELRKKYGYADKDGSTLRMFRLYGKILIALLAALAGIVLFLLYRYRREKVRTAEEMERLREKFAESERHAERTKEKLEREEQETKRLVTDISHQLKTPLAALKMSRELLHSTDLTEEERREFSEKEDKEIKRLETLLHSFMELTRLETNMIQIRPKRESMQEVLAAAVGNVYMKAWQKSIDISVEEFTDMSVNCDAKWTAEAIANVLDNGVKYAPEGSRITLRVSLLSTCAMIEIEDEGPGILREEAPRIFQRFYRGEQAQKEEGSGVGLYLTRKILEEQGGTICVKPGREKGSCFILTILLDSL